MTKKKCPTKIGASEITLSTTLTLSSAAPQQPP